MVAETQDLHASCVLSSKVALKHIWYTSDSAEQPALGAAEDALTVEGALGRAVVRRDGARVVMGRVVGGRDVGGLDSAAAGADDTGIAEVEHCRSQDKNPYEQVK